MDYKTVIEEQIETLQKVQKEISSVANVMNASECCQVSNTIRSLCDWLIFLEKVSKRG